MLENTLVGLLVGLCVLGITFVMNIEVNLVNYLLGYAAGAIAILIIRPARRSGHRPAPENITTIAVDRPLEIGDANGIMIGEEVLEIFPIDSKDGQLFKIVDKKKKKGVLLRLKRYGQTTTSVDIKNVRQHCGHRAEYLYRDLNNDIRCGVCGQFR